MNFVATKVGANGQGFGIIFRDGEGNILAVAWKYLDQMMETRLMEVQSMVWRLSLAWELCFLDLEVEYDCLEVI